MSAIGPYAFSPATPLAGAVSAARRDSACRKDGRRTLILRAELEAYIAGLSTARRCRAATMDGSHQNKLILKVKDLCLLRLYDVRGANDPSCVSCSLLLA